MLLHDIANKTFFSLRVAIIWTRGINILKPEHELEFHFGNITVELYS